MKATSSPDPGIVATLLDDIRYELMEISAQSFVRGIDNPLLVQEAFGEEDEEAQDMIDSILSWESLRKQIFESTEKGGAGLTKIASDLYETALQNHRFYRKVAAGYSEMAQKLSLPRKPGVNIRARNRPKKGAEGKIVRKRQAEEDIHTK